MPSLMHVSFQQRVFYYPFPLCYTYGLYPEKEPYRTMMPFSSLTRVPGPVTLYVLPHFTGERELTRILEMKRIQHIVVAARHPLEEGDRYRFRSQSSRKVARRPF